MLSRPKDKQTGKELLAGRDDLVSAQYLDLASDALAWVDENGYLHPLNEAMVSLQVQAQTDSGDLPLRLLDLPSPEEDLEALGQFLVSGEERHECSMRFGIASGDRLLRAVLQVDAERGGYRLALRDETEARTAIAHVLRLERLRLLGGMAEGLVHDLNNLMGTLIGFAEHLKDLTQDGDQTKFLESVLEGTKAHSAMLQNLHGLMKNNSIHKERVALRSLVADTLQLFSKTASYADLEVASEYGDDTPEVRVVIEDAMHVILQLLCFSLGGHRRDSLIRVETGRQTRPAPRQNLPSRTYGFVRIMDSGDASEGERLGEIAKTLDLADDSGLVLVLMTLQFSGGLFEYESLEGHRRSFTVFLPAAHARRDASREG